MPATVIKLEGQDNASRVIKGVERNLQDLGKSAPKQIDLGSVTDQLSGLGSGRGLVEGLGSALGAALPVAGLGVAAGAIASVSWELGKAGAETVRTRDAFADLAAASGTSAQAMLDGMRDAARGTVADTNLMAAANRALVLGVAEDADTMAKLTAAAIIRGRQVGVGATQAIGDLVTGIGRMSPEILDNLGIANAKTAFDSYAASLGTTADKLTDVQKKQALVNATLASVQGASVVDDAASSFERMDAAIQNAKDSLGVLFSPAIAAIADSIAAGATAALNATKGEATALDKQLGDLEDRALILQQTFTMSQGQDTPADTGAQAQAAAFRTLQFAIQQANQAMAAGTPEAKSWGETLNFVATESLKTGVVSEQNTLVLGSLLAIMAQAGNATQETGDAMGDAAGKASVLASALSKVQAQAGATAGLIYDVGDAVNWLNQNTGAGGILEKSQSSLQGIAQMLVEQGSMQASGISGWLEGATATFDQWLAAQQQAGVNGEALDVAAQAYLGTLRQSNQELKAHAGGLSDAQKAWNDLNSQVSGALQQSTSLDAIGVNPADYLPRADAVQEDAFRLADIMVNGFNSPWVSYFQTKFPQMWQEMSAGGDIQAGAAKVLQQFQAGFRPELLNFDALKEQVKNALLSQEAFASMSKQITDQLVAEMGVSAQDVQGALASVVGPAAGGAAGAPDLTGQGNTAGTQFSTGFGSTANGTALVATITAQITASLNQFDSSGRVAGTTWAGGFISVVQANMAPSLIQLLVQLVTPGVMAAMQVNQSQTGAQP